MSDRPASPPSRQPPTPPPDRRRRAAAWHTGDILRAAALIILLYLFLRLLWFANALVFVVFLGVLFGLAVSAGVDRLERLRIPRGIGAAITVAGFFAVLVGVGAIVAPTLRQQARELRNRLPEAIERIEGWMERQRDGVLGSLVRGLVPEEDTTVADPVRDTSDSAAIEPPTPGDSLARDATRDTTRGSERPAVGIAEGRADPERASSTRERAPPVTERSDARDTTPAGEDPISRLARQDSALGDSEPGVSLRERITDQLAGASSFFFQFLSSTLAVISGMVLIIFLAVFIATDPGLYHRGLLHLFPHHMRPRIGEVLTATATTLRRWLITQLVGMTVIGVVTTIVLLILGVEAAFALGFLAGLLEFIPTIGPLLSAIPAVAMGFLDSPQTALYVALAYFIIQQLESNILMPLLMQEGVDLPPALSIIFQALMALVFGFLGLLVAVPLLAAAMVPIKMLYVEDVVGDDVVVPGDDDESDDDPEERARPGGRDEPRRRDFERERPGVASEHAHHDGDV